MLDDDHYSRPAVLSGDVFCAPWCGCGCKKSAFDQATAEAETLAARMGDGWEARVWENGGWHYEVSKGAARITVQTATYHADGARRGTGALSGGWEVVSYSCWLDADKIRPQVIEEAETPEAALGIATQVARGQIQTAHAALATINE